MSNDFDCCLISFINKSGKYLNSVADLQSGSSLILDLISSHFILECSNTFSDLIFVYYY